MCAAGMRAQKDPHVRIRLLRRLPGNTSHVDFDFDFDFDFEILAFQLLLPASLAFFILPLFMCRKLTMNEVKQLDGRIETIGMGGLGEGCARVWVGCERKAVRLEPPHHQEGELLRSVVVKS